MIIDIINIMIKTDSYQYKIIIDIVIYIIKISRILYVLYWYY